ncbi:hypothetical protein GTA08_BOTSDO07492 [Botryosphaeria dothidea]|uniref:Uncharacterized protein n=1 Tax=Botryosphaeria dothidea TaxID=55169 RepID=A0A8H4IQW7_9PEZI|nr:hypothetical protein GTA08_BOTSDO07492 [Botryosphaeria dothidea]
MAALTVLTRVNYRWRRSPRIVYILEGLQGNSDHWVCQKERIREELIKKANGMPLCASLMLEIIADMDGDDSKIEEQLEKLPGDVEPIYEKKLLQIQDDR